MDILIYFGVLAGAFAILAKSADAFVDSAVGMAETLRVPKMVIGIVLVGFATTAPEFAVSVQSAYLGHPEIALGNAVGSVICDDGIAMALAAIIASTPILIDRKILKTTGIFLVFIYVVTYVMALGGTLNRYEGALLVLILAGYIYSLFMTTTKKRRDSSTLRGPVEAGESPRSPTDSGRDLRRQFMNFGLGLAGVVISSRLVIWASLHIAEYFRIPEVIIGLTVIAIGTSLPEIGTCIAAARKGQGEIAAGNIIGADILNILWIVGVSAMVNPMHVSTKIVNFMFPWMFLIVGTMLVSMRINYRIGKPKGIILLSLYAIYLFMTVKFFY
jgi:cation:H+ antiporter